MAKAEAAATVSEIAKGMKLTPRPSAVASATGNTNTAAAWVVMRLANTVVTK